MIKQSFYTAQISNCDRRRLDLDKIKKYLQNHQFHEIEEPEYAEYIIIMSCSTTDANTKDSVELIETLYKRSYKSSKIIIGGCLSKTEIPIELQDKIVLSFNPKEGFDPVQSIFNYADNLENIPDVNNEDKNILSVRIQSGCRGMCTFCDIRNKIGRSVSRSEANILNDVKQSIHQDVNLVRLVGDDVGAYDNDLSQLILSINKLFDKKIIIDNLDPKYLVRYWDKLIPLVKDNTIFHIKLPVQHFNKRILKMMKRYDDIDIMTEYVAMLRSYNINLQSHFIVGFPTETEEELMAAAKKVVQLFGQVAFIPYSKKEDSAAASFSGHISKEVIKSRMMLLKHEFMKDYNVTIPYVDNDGIEEVKVVKEGYSNGRL